jgi:UDP-N-acetylglucosamine transferase subunit ALG13
MIGYYAHYQGHGHCSYAEQLSEHLSEPLQIFTSSQYEFSNGSSVHRLLDEDVDGREINLPRGYKPRFLHHNPVGLKKITERSRYILDQVMKNDISLMLVDVSVEVATLCRVASIPYAYRRMPGDRLDTGHIEAYRGAVFLFAYYPQEMEDADMPSWIKEKTFYTGFISPAGLEVITTGITKDMSGEPQSILVIMGMGGHDFTADDILQLAQEYPDAEIQTIGKYYAIPSAPNYTHHGVVDDITDYAAEADVIITACGSSTVSTLLAMRRKFICVPQKRPYNEQHRIADFLVEQQLAVQLLRSDFKRAIKELQTLPKKVPDSFIPGDMSGFANSLKDFTHRLVNDRELVTIN